MEDPRKTSLQRLLDAADQKGVKGAAAVARALNVSDQVVNNWKTRGVAHSKATVAQQLWGVSASWIATGKGDMWITSRPSAKAPPSPPGQRFDAVTEDEHLMLMAFRGMSDDDRAELTAEMEQRAKRWAEIVAKVLAQTRPAKNGQT